MHQWISDPAPSVQLVWWRVAARIIYCIKVQNREFCCESFWLPYLKSHCKLNQYSYANTPWKWLFYWNNEFVNKKTQSHNLIIFPLSGASCLLEWGISGKKILNISITPFLANSLTLNLGPILTLCCTIIKGESAEIFWRCKVSLLLLKSSLCLLWCLLDNFQGSGWGWQEWSAG